MKKVGVFADVSNLWFCINKKFDKNRLNYAAFLEYAIRDGELYRAYAYGAQMEKEASPFLNRLVDLGFTTKYKRPKVFRSEGQEVRKADWDVGLAMDVVRLLPRIDVCVIGTGDGDLTPLVEYVQKSGVLVHIIGCNISYELKEVADICTEIDESLLEGK